MAHTQCVSRSRRQPRMSVGPGLLGRDGRNQVRNLGEPVTVSADDAAIATITRLEGAAKSEARARTLTL